MNSLLGAERDFGYLQMHSGFRFSLYEMASSLVYARACAPCSKSKTFHEVLPQLMEETGFSLGQLYEGLAFLGEEYEKVVEIYNARVAELWPRNTASTNFDCTNLYFEIYSRVSMVAVAFLSNRLLLQKSILGNGRFHLKAARDTSFRHTIY